MGWVSGSSLAEDIWKEFRKLIPEALKKRAARRLIQLFENYDCDTLDECEQLMKDAKIIRREDE